MKTTTLIKRLINIKNSNKKSLAESSRQYNKMQVIAGLMNETQLTGSTPVPAAALHMERLRIDSYISKLLASGKVNDERHMVNIINKVIAKYNLSPKTAEFIRNYAVEKYRKHKQQP